MIADGHLIWTSRVFSFGDFQHFAAHRAGTQVYGASAATLAGHSAGHTSYDTATAYPNTAAFAGWFLITISV